MFRIEEVSSPRCNLKFGHPTQDSNQVSVITGPNGSGKTEILRTLSDWFSRSSRTRPPADTNVEWTMRWRGGEADEATAYSDHPPRVIAQTFSPFSRFAPPARSYLTILDVYAKEAEQTSPYRSIGINRGSRMVGGMLGRSTLEQGIFRLSEDPEQAKILGAVLESLGFAEKFRLEYRNNPLGNRLLTAHREGHLLELLEEQALEVRKPKATEVLRRELRKTSVEETATFLDSVLQVLQSRLADGHFQFDFDLRYGRASEDYAVLQSLSVLRRLDSVSLQKCTLFPYVHEPIDLADASSGQQQMLCSLFGLFAELRSNSLVLIDEPELSLHPTWQMEFLERLQTVLRPFQGCHVIVATHSPLIVQSALMQNFEVIQLSPEESGSPADALIQNQEAVSVEGTLLDVFGTPVTGSVYLANEIFELVTEAEAAGTSVGRKIVLDRLQRLESLYYQSGADANSQGDLDIIRKALRLVSDSENFSYGV
jgi:predicted ATPase